MLKPNGQQDKGQHGDSAVKYDRVILVILASAIASPQFHPLAPQQIP